MKKYLVRLCSSVCVVLLLCHLSSCKDPVITDKGITSNSQDNINLAHFDTGAVLINTVAEIPLQSSGVSTAVLGSMNDPYLGKTFAGFYAQCLLSNNGAYFDSGRAVDSAVLYLPYINDSSKYGKCQIPIDIIVYEVSQDIFSTNTYYSNDAFAVNSQAIGRLNNYTPDLIDSTKVRGYTRRPQIAVKLSSAFAQKLLNTDSTSLSSSTNFLSYLKGIYVTTNTAKIGDGISYLDLYNAKISLFYHNHLSDTLQFDFPISSYSATVNHFDHQYSGTPVQAAISYPGSNGDKTGFIQAGVGTKLRVRIPDITRIGKLTAKHVTDTAIAVTKAELILPVGDTISFPPPPSSDLHRIAVTLYRIDDTLATQTLNVYNRSGVGTLTTRLDNAGASYLCYVFSLTEYIQRVLNGYYHNNGFYVEYSYTVRGDRVIIKNDPALDATKSKLKITYTKLQ